MRRIPGWLVLAGAELVLLRRSPLAVANAVLGPLALGVAWVLLAKDSGKSDGGDTAAMQLLMLLGFAPYVGATATIATRRQELVLKRLRTCDVSNTGIIAGLLTPFALLVVLQSAVLFSITIVVGGQEPVRWWPLLAAVAGGTVLAMAFAFVTAAFTPAPELVQLTSTPFFLGLFGGGMWLLHTGTATWPMRAVPGVPVADLVRLAWRHPGASQWEVLHQSAPSLLAILLLAASAVALAVRTFRWELRR
jgi:ABC-2 type transport system permease protein